MLVCDPVLADYKLLSVKAYKLEESIRESLPLHLHTTKERAVKLWITKCAVQSNAVMGLSIGNDIIVIEFLFVFQKSW